MNSSSKPNIQKDEDSQISEISLSQFADDVGFNRNNNDIIDVNNQPTSPSFTQQPQNVQDPPPIQVEILKRKEKNKSISSTAIAKSTL